MRFIVGALTQEIMTDQERGQAEQSGAGVTPPESAAAETGGTGTGAASEAAAPGAASEAEAGAAVSGADAATSAAEQAAQAASAADLNGAVEQLAKLQAELEALNDRHLRLAAEFDNYRKRVERERTELWGRAQGELAKRLLEVLDDLQRVSELDVATATAASLLEGIQLVEKKMRHALESMGLEPIDPRGEFFNPETMEALMMLPAESPEEDEVVVDVFQKGYRFKGHLIRPARVRVKKYEA
nr:MAG: nucleotide exchange factor GrpE [bacterium]